MCGIFGYMGARSDAAELVLSGLKSLEYRGYDSWGIAVADNGHVALDKRVGKIGDTTTELPSSHMALGHTRWATHGGVSDANAHPQLDCMGRLAVVHNGSVSNEAQLRRALSRAGHRLRSQTDTELIAHLIEDLLEQMPDGPERLVQATIAAFRKLRGLNAITVLDVRRGEMVAAKSGSPLCVGFGDSGYFLASDHGALVAHTRRVSFLRDGQAVVIRRAGVQVYDMASALQLEPEITQVEWNGTQPDRGGHPDFMTKEILEQPSLLRLLAERAPVYVKDLAARIDQAQEVFVVGCGSSAHAAHVAQYLFARAGRRVHYSNASEFAYLYPFLGSRSLVIALSQSGETVDVLDAVRAARERGAGVVGITNVEGSTLWRQADFALPLGVGPERCVLATKSLSAQLALLLLTAYAMNRQLDDARSSLCRAADDIERLLSESSRAEIQGIAHAVQSRDHLYVLGRGPNHALALETALKIKEVSYIHAEGFAGGELSHGVMALIEPHTPCIVLAPQDETHADCVANALQVKARGGTLIGITPKPQPAFDHCIRVTDVGPATLISNTIPAQLLGYELARLRGRDPDMPRNLAKSVTVK
ncbi:MAG: glutamine--fructose-6-phosphate transaminase (isomerizing) [Polyangiales bacterium]